jgi:hypothetical protein
MIVTTIYRVFPANQWRSMPAEALAAAITQPAALRQMDRKTLFGAVVQAGGDTAALRQLYGYSAYMQDVETALRDGDLAAAQGLLLLCPVDLPSQTQTIIAGVLAGATLRAVDVVAAELGQPAPAQIDAAAVTAALIAAGWTWDNGHWQRRMIEVA